MTYNPCLGGIMGLEAGPGGEDTLKKNVQIRTPFLELDAGPAVALHAGRHYYDLARTQERYIRTLSALLEFPLESLVTTGVDQPDASAAPNTIQAAAPTTVGKDGNQRLLFVTAKGAETFRLITATEPQTAWVAEDFTREALDELASFSERAGLSIAQDDFSKSLPPMSPESLALLHTEIDSALRRLNLPDLDRVLSGRSKFVDLQLADRLDLYEVLFLRNRRQEVRQELSRKFDFALADILGSEAGREAAEQYLSLRIRKAMAKQPFGWLQSLVQSESHQLLKKLEAHELPKLELRRLLLAQTQKNPKAASYARADLILNLYRARLEF